MTLSIKEKLNAYNIISFDLYDTLIFRSVSSPHKIYEVVQNLYNAENKDCIFAYPVERFYAESRARFYYKREVTLDEIYSFISYPLDVKLKLKKLEEKSEIYCSVPNPPMIDLLRWCKNKKKKIVITSDMYLPRNCIEKILEKNAIEYDLMLLSSEEKETKADGRLFGVLIKKLNVNPCDVIHIGDNYLSDLQNPQKYGISSLERICKKSNEKIITYAKSKLINIDILNSLYKENLQNYCENTETFRMGFCVIGPFLTNFCNWLHIQKNEKNIDRLVFLSREGYLIKKIYDCLYPKDNTIYMSLNKNLLRLPSLKIFDMKTFLKSLPPRRKRKWGDVIAYLGIEENYLEFKEKDVSINELENETSKKIFDSIKRTIQKKCSEQTNLLIDYLKENNVLKKRIGLVNNSINGNGQELLEKICKENEIDLNIIGFQFYATKECKEKLKSNMCFYFENNSLSVMGQIFSHFCLPFEHLLFEPVGTALRFSKKNDRVCVVYDSIGLEEKNIKIVEEIQKFAILFSEHYKEYFHTLDTSSFNRVFFKFILFPYENDADVIASLWNVEMDWVSQLNDLNSNYSPFKIIFQLPQGVCWPEGYLASKNASYAVKSLYVVKLILSIYLHQPGIIISDLKKIRKNLIINIILALKSFLKKLLCFVHMKYFKVKTFFHLYSVHKLVSPKRG